MSGRQWKIAAWTGVLVTAATWGQGWVRGIAIAAVLVGGIAQAMMAVDICTAGFERRKLHARQWIFAALLLAAAVVFPQTDWWRHYVVSLLPCFASLLIYLFTEMGSRRA